MSSRSLPTEGLEWPRPTMSKACSSGTPAFIITASWRVKMVMSLSVIFLPPPVRTFLIDWTWMPWRRRFAATADSPAARLSPLITFPVLSLPVQEKLYCLTSAAGFFATAAMVVSLLLVGDALDLFQLREPFLHLDQARLAQVLDAFARSLVGQVDRGAVLHDDAFHLLGDGHDLVDPDPAFVAGIFTHLAPDGTKRLPCSIQIIVPESRPFKGFRGDFDRFLATAKLPREALGGDHDHGRGDVERRDAHVHEAGERLRCVVGVQRRQHHVAGLCRLDRDLAGLHVADL